MVCAPPNATATYHSNLFNYLTTITVSPNPVLIVGDFNLPDINWLTFSGITSMSNNFCEFVFEPNLTQPVESPKHSHGNILDLALINSSEQVTHLSVHYQCITSDHHLITFSISYCSNPCTTTKEFLNFTRGDYTGLTVC